MATAVATGPTRTLEGERRFLLPGVGWEGYEALLKMIGDRRVRVTFDGEDAELMSPSQNHEFYKRIIGWMLEALFEELNVPYEPAGSTTWRNRAGGLEPDECYYLSNLALVRQKRNSLDLNADPAPDLAVEIEISRGALDRLGLYAALGVAEVWRFDGETLRIERLQGDGTYQQITTSLALPAITPDEVVHWARLAETTDDRLVWNRRFRQWARAELVPRLENR